MRRLREAAGCMLLLGGGLIALGLASDRWILIGPLLVLTVFGSFFEGRLRKRPGPVVFLALMAPFGALLQLWPLQMKGASLDPNINFHIALFACTASVLRALGPRDRWRVALPVVAGGLCLMAAGIARDAPGYKSMIVVYAFGLATAAPALRRPQSVGRHLVVGTAFWVAAGLGLALTSVFEARFQDINRAVQRALMGRAPDLSGGFSGTARLDGIQDMRGFEGGSAIAVRAVGPKAPGYLKGKVFRRYDEGQWDVGASSRPSIVELTSRGLILFEDRPEPLPGTGPDWRIRPESHSATFYFVPLLTTAVEGERQFVEPQPGGILHSLSGTSDEGYDVYVSPAPVLTEPHPWETELPGDRRLLAALDRILADLPPGDDPDLFVLRLVEWFEERYEYRIGIEFDEDRDPIEQFLTERSHGHCEMFAAAGALLLRRAGIPSRYVTGFVCAEKNPHLDLWVARSRHAHAWVEYRHPERGWQIAEFTPPDGQPVVTEPGWFEAWWEYLKSTWRELLETGRLAELLRLLLGAIGVLVVAVGLLVGLRGWRGRARSVRQEARVLPPAVEEVRRRFLAAEALLRRRDLGRRRSETLLEYAARLDRSDAAEGASLARELGAVRYARWPDGGA